jgi:hypothetical protein
MLEVFRRGDHRLLRLADVARSDESTAYVLLLYFALIVFQFLDGTVTRDGL